MAADVSRNTAPARPGTRPLRGRSAELDTALRAVRSARAGHPALVLVRGEPGIGKTAFVRAIIERAGWRRAAGMPLALVRAPQFPGEAGIFVRGLGLRTRVGPRQLHERPSESRETFISLRYRCLRHLCG